MNNLMVCTWRPVKTVSTFDQHLFNKSWTDVGQILKLSRWAIQHFENKGKIELMLKESLNRFKTWFNMLSTFFTFSTMLEDLFKRTKHLVQQHVECMLKQMLKPFKQAITQLWCPSPVYWEHKVRHNARLQVDYRIYPCIMRACV